MQMLLKIIFILCVCACECQTLSDVSTAVGLTLPDLKINTKPEECQSTICGKYCFLLHLKLHVLSISNPYNFQ